MAKNNGSACIRNKSKKTNSDSGEEETIYLMNDIGLLTSSEGEVTKSSPFALIVRTVH